LYKDIFQAGYKIFVRIIGWNFYDTGPLNFLFNYSVYRRFRKAIVQKEYPKWRSGSQSLWKYHLGWSRSCRPKWSWLVKSFWYGK